MQKVWENMLDIIREHRKQKGYDKRSVNVNGDKAIEECNEFIETLEYGCGDHLVKQEAADVIISLVGYCDSRGWDIEELVKNKIIINNMRDR